jgi:signal transduction histidine kinase
MDSEKVNDDTYTNLLYQTYKYKFSKTKYDLIMSSDDDALSFVLTHRDTLFKDVPYVFCGANSLQDYPNKLKGQALITGINKDTSIKESLDIGLKIQPNIKNIYFIHDNTSTGSIEAKKINEISSEYAGKYNITVLDGSMTEQEILKTVKNIPSDSLIYLTTFDFVKNGKHLNTNDFLKDLRAITNVPIFGTWDFYLGDGIIGGKLTSGNEQGSYAADIGVRVLMGESITNIPVVMNSPNIYEFDNNELLAHKSTLINLPKDSYVINQQDGFSISFRYSLWIIAAAFILLVLIIIWLIYKNRSNRIRAQKEAEEYKIKLAEKEALINAENNFINVASHELRTPMTVIRGFINILQREKIGVLNTKQEDVLNTISRNTEGLIELVNNMLDLSKFEAGKMELKISENYIDELVVNAIDNIRILYDTKGISLDYYGVHKRILTDSDAFVRILLNLLSNSYKYTNAGGSVIVTSTIDEPIKMATVCISDTGVGIPVEAIGKLFEKFSQVDNYLQRQAGGSGLGLAICRQMVEKLGGKIWVESEEGSGSKFYFTMPLSDKETSVTPNQSVIS